MICRLDCVLLFYFLQFFAFRDVISNCKLHFIIVFMIWRFCDCYCCLSRFCDFYCLSYPSKPHSLRNTQSCAARGGLTHRLTSFPTSPQPTLLPRNVCGSPGPSPRIRGLLPISPLDLCAARVEESQGLLQERARQHRQAAGPEGDGRRVRVDGQRADAPARNLRARGD